MKKVFIGVGIVFVLAITGWAILMRNDSNDNTTKNAEQNSSSSTKSESNPEPGATTTVNITNMLFSPSQVTIQKGDFVTWTNNDSADHTVTADTGNGPKSETIKPGSKYTYTFDETGSFQYHCDFHSAMHGTVVVQ